MNAQLNPRLVNREIYLVLDKSGSMTATDTPSGKSRWESARESTVALANLLQPYDPDGITVIPFASGYKPYNNTTPATVESIFRENSPMGGTTLAPVLKHIFAEHTAAKKAGTAKANGSLVLVVTDGEPNDPADVARAISDFTKTLGNGDDEFGIQFVQVGKDTAARDYLKKLDDALTSGATINGQSVPKAQYDIVDTITMEEVENKPLEEVLLGALDD